MQRTISMKNTFVITILLLLLSRGGFTQESNFLQESSEKDRTVRSHAKLHNGDSDDHDSGISENLILLIVLPTVVVIALVVIIAIIVCIVYRTHFSYGNVCCFKPKRRPVRLEDPNDYQLEESGSPSPPVYPGMNSAAPPVYCDAINDVILLKGVDPSTVSLPPYVPPQSSSDQSALTASTQPDSSLITESQATQSQARHESGNDDDEAKDSTEESLASEDSSPEQKLISK